MPNPADILLVDFPGAVSTKKRPAVVLSTTLYHRHRPDIIVELLTTNIIKATAPTDYILQDWSTAGLRQPTAFRAYLLTLTYGSFIGHLSDRDWQGVQACLGRALAIPGT